MNITWFSRKFTYNWFMCLLGGGGYCVLNGSEWMMPYGGH